MLASQGAGGAVCKLASEQIQELERVLDAGPAIRGFVDQRWTLVRVQEMIPQEFGVTYSVSGVDLLLCRLGWSARTPTRRASERGEEEIAFWRGKQWELVKNRGGPGRLALFQRRGGAGAEVVQGPHLGAARLSPDRAGERRRIGPDRVAAARSHRPELGRPGPDDRPVAGDALADGVRAAIPALGRQETARPRRTRRARGVR